MFAVILAHPYSLCPCMSCHRVAFQVLFTNVYQRRLRPNVIQKVFVPSSLFRSDLTEAKYLEVSKHYNIYIW